MESVAARSNVATIIRWWRYGLFVGAACLVPLHAVAQTWVPTDISVLGGAASSEATAVSDIGTVVGTYSVGSYTHGFIWTGGTGWKDMGTFGGFNGHTSPQAVNTAGYVAGYATTPDFPYPNNSTTHAFRRSPAGGMVDLGTLGGPKSYALGINNAGQVVGYSETSYGNYRAFLWSEAIGMVDLGTLGGTASVARSVNKHGEVAGSSRVAGDAAWHAFRWASGTMTDLGTPGGTSDISEMNDAGTIVGNFWPDSGGPHAFVRNAAGLIVDLGAGTVANGVNNAGQIVGHSLPATQYIHATIWSGPWKDLVGNYGSRWGIWALRENSWLQIHTWSPKALVRRLRTLRLDEQHDVAVLASIGRDPPGSR